MTGALYARLPYGGLMRLIDEVVSVDDNALTARASGHRGADHPLRRAGRLHGLAAIEYAAQACALHGAWAGRLGAGAGEGAAVVATVQQLALAGGDLDRAGPVLTIEVRCAFRQTDSAVYTCVVSDGGDWCCRLLLGLVSDALEAAPQPG